MNITKLLVKNILEHADQYEWTIQGMGMLRMYLDRETRIHVWDSRYQIPYVSMVHDHPLELWSEVIAGQILDISYINAREEEGQCHKYYINRILCGEGAEELGNPEVSFLRRNTKGYGSGDKYIVTKSQLHSTQFLDGTVTLVSRSNRDSGRAGDIARTGWPESLGPNGWVSAEPRPATIDQVNDIVGNSLKKFF